jgi:ribonuclease HI
MNKNNTKSNFKDSTSTPIMHVDGGARGNPGDSGIGIVIDNKNTKKGYYFFLNRKTNNEAEYMALLTGIELSINNKIDNIKVYTDSELVYKQISGEYKVKNENLKKLYLQVNEKIKKFNSFSLNHVKREKNKEADKLANMAMDFKKNGEIELL